MKSDFNVERSELDGILRSFWRNFATIAVFSFVLNILMIAPAIYAMQVYDRVMISRNEMTLLMLTLIILALYGLQSALDYFRTIILNRVGAQLDLQLNKRVFDATFERYLQGIKVSPVQALQDLNLVRQTLTGPGVLALLDAPWIPVLLGLNFFFSPVLGLFAVASALLMVILSVFGERLTKEHVDTSQGLGVKSNYLISSHIRNAEVVRAMGMLGNIRYRWSAVHRNFLRSQSQATDRTSLLTAMTKFVRNSNQSLMIGLGVLELLQGRMTSGMMIASSMLLGRALMPIEMLIMNWRGLLTARNAYSRLQELLEQFPEVLPGMPLPKPAGRIDFENVSAVAPFSKTPILHNIALTIPAGKTVAVIGPSAAGKSTLSRLLVGVWPASEGVVRLDDFDVFAWDKDSLGPHIGYLPQDIELFDGTLAENICRFGQIDSEKVIRAAQLVGMHETILHFPKGYDTPLGDSGCYLSGGQRQRIGLARALYGDPSLIVLDEPNSSLDDAGVQALIVTLQALKKANRTVVLITHQLNLLNLVDSILVLADGAVRLYGPRDEVIAALSGAQRKSAAVTSEKSLAGSSS